MSSVALAHVSGVEDRIRPGASSALAFLLGCCGSGDFQIRGSHIQQLLAAGIAAQELLTLAEQHGLLPQLYERLSAHASSLPDDFLPCLRTRFERNVRQTLFLTQLLGTVLDAFDHHRIEALVLKGPALAEMLYDDVGLRQFSDIDLLVHPADVQRCKLALKGTGYAPTLELTPKEERANIASGYEYVFDGTEHKSIIELQWRILPRFYAVDFDTEHLFHRAETMDVCGRRLKTITGEDLLLVLCVHAAKHLWQRIAWIRDIAELARTRTIDWERVKTEAKQLGIQRIVAITFYLAQELLGYAMPAAVQVFWKDDAAGRCLRNEILKGIWEGREIGTESPAYFRLMVRVRERHSDRVRFLWRLAMTPTITEWRMIKLPAALFPVYRVVRLGRLFGRAFRTRQHSNSATNE